MANREAEEAEAFPPGPSPIRAMAIAGERERLRDYFAGQAIAPLVKRGDAFATIGWDAYRIADGMLTARAAAQGTPLAQPPTGVAGPAGCANGWHVMQGHRALPDPR